jgi:hypothetical protein
MPTAPAWLHEPVGLMQAWLSHLVDPDGCCSTAAQAWLEQVDELMW